MKHFAITGLLLSVLSGLTLSGCATLAVSDVEKINVSSNSDQRFTVTVDGKGFVVPGTVLMERDGEDKELLSGRNGCARSTPINKTITPYFFGNVFFGYFSSTGATIDYQTGMMWNYDNNVTIDCVE